MTETYMKKYITLTYVVLQSTTTKPVSIVLGYYPSVLHSMYFVYLCVFILFVKYIFDIKNVYI